VESRFFETVSLQRQVRYQALQLGVLTLDLVDLLAGGVPDGIPGEPFFAGFHEFLGPGIVGAGLDAFAAAKITHRYFTAKTLEYNPDLLFRGVFPPGGYPDLLDETLGSLSPGFSGFGFVLVILGHEKLLSE
jgi:hypothetical protein